MDSEIKGNRWTIVLSGGEGERMQPFIRNWLGQPRPKQYCSFTGGRTMLEHTLERAVMAAGSRHIVTVINHHHLSFLRMPRPLDIPGRIIAQPRRCDTGPGVFLPLTAIIAQDPEALVAIMPSDHFIHPKERFQETLDEAFRLAEYLPGQLILLAARPSGSEPDYGWISPGKRLPDSHASLVKRFKEKPQYEEAQKLRREGGLWNTMIVVARAGALWDMAKILYPGMIARFEALKPWLGTDEEADAMELVYRKMPEINFSHGLLEKVAEWTVVLPLDGVHWSDWGRPERIEETLNSIGSKSTLPGINARRTPAVAAAAA